MDNISPRDNPKEKFHVRHSSANHNRSKTTLGSMSGMKPITPDMCGKIDENM
jgi:hypothetical protein